MVRHGRLLLCVAATLASLSLAPAHAANAANAPAQLTEEQRALHVLNRLGYGPRPGDLEMVTSLGVDKYIDEQLHPQNIRLPNELL
ncbi:MAG: DUF1800 family protein, partial [Burkholderiaceae bacterium]|nr:DUF1800 family protein [Burkholderiaceae bacterium]